MKKFSKVLALLLALMTVVAMLPMNVFAKEWGKIQAETTETENGTESDVVISIDADALAALIKEKGLSADLIYALKDGVTVDGLRSLFSMEELFRIIPRDEWLEVFTLDDIINTVGIKKLTAYIEDYAALLRSIAESETAVADLSALMGKVANLEKCVNALTLLENEYLVPTAENLLAGKDIYDLIKESLTVEDSELIGLLKIDQSLIDLFIGKINAFTTLEELDQLLKLEKILRDGTLLKPEDVLKANARDTFIATLSDYIHTVSTTNHDEFEALLDSYVGNESLEAIKQTVTNRVKAELEGKINAIRNDSAITTKEEATAKLDAVLAGYKDTFTVTYTVEIVGSTVQITYTDPVIKQNDNVLLFQKAWESNWITIDDLCPTDDSADLVDTEGLWHFFLFDKNLVDLNEVADFDTAKAKALAIANDAANLETLLDPANGYVVYAEALKLIGIKNVIAHIEGGYEALLGGTDPMINVSATDGLISKIDLEATLKNILNAVNNKEISLESVIKLDELLNQLEAAGVLGEIANYVSYEAIFAQLDTEELFEILQLLDLKKYMKPALILAVNNLLANVDKIEIDGTTVAGEDPNTALLQIYPQLLLETITKLLPKLDDILAPEFDGILLNTNLNLEYTVDGEAGVTPDYGTTKSKKIAVKFEITGNISSLQAKLAEMKERLLDPFFNEFILDGTNVTLNMNVPSVIAELLKQVVNSDELDEDLRKMLVQVGESEEDLLAFVNGQLTLDNIREILNAVDVDALYNIMKNVGLVKTVLELYDEKTGSSLSNKSLDELMKFVGTSEHTLDDVCTIIQNKTGKDVKALLDKIAFQYDDKMSDAQKIAVVEKLLKAVENKLGINVAAISAQEIIARAENKPLVDVIANVIVEKLGVDVKAILNNYTAQELYEKALNKITTSQKVSNALDQAKELLDSLSKKDLSLRLADYYQGNGTFHFTFSKQYNAKAVIEKLVNKVLSISKVEELDIPDKAIDLLLNSIADAGNSTASVDLTLNVANLYRIQFFSREDLNNPAAKPLYTAFLPVGATLSLFENNKEITGYAFTGWADKNGNEIVGQVMPEGDIDVYADAHSAEIKFETENGQEIGVILLPPASNVNLLNYADANGKLYFDAILNSTYVKDGAPVINPAVNAPSELYWYVKGDESKTAVDLTTKFVDGTTLVCAYKIVYRMGATDLKGNPLDIEVTEDNGAYSVVLKNWDYKNGLALDFDEALLQRAAAGTDNVSLTITDATGGIFKVVLDNATLASLAAQNAKTFKYAYGYENELNGFNSEFKDSMYAQNAFVGNNFCKPEYVSFQILSVNDTEITTFGENNTIVISVPFAHTGAANTNVYAWTDGKREAIERDFSEAGKITFKAPHFSDFVTLNEYAINFVDFVTEDGFKKEGWLATESQAGVIYFPVGATFKLDFTVVGNFEAIKVTDNNTQQTYQPGSVYTVTGDASFTVTLRGDLYYVYYYINGTLWHTQSYVKNSGFSQSDILTVAQVLSNNTQQSLPADFFNKYVQSSGKWAGLDALTYLNTRDIVLTAVWDTVASVYTIKFNVPTGVTAVPDMTVTSSDSVATIVAGLTLPAIPANAKAGAYWDVANYTVSGNQITITLKYAEKVNAIVNNAGATVTDAAGNAITSAVAGTTVTVVAPTKEHYDAAITVVTAQNPNNNLFNGTNFVMPDEIVYVNVTYTPKTYTYIYNGTTLQAPYGTTVTLDPITVEKGKVIDTVAISGTLSKIELVSVTTNANGAKVFVYAFDLLENNVTVQITTRALTLNDILNIFNGKVFEGDSVESGVDNVQFLSWSETVLNSFRFATFGLIDDTTSLLWLWILLAILLFVLIITVLYRLIKGDKMRKPRFLVSFVLWVVSIFFIICRAFAAVALKIARLFGKSDKAEDYGYTTVPEAEESEEQTTEETTDAVEETEETDAVEETEEAVIEDPEKKVVLMMPSSQPTEEVAEEVTEEVAEEVTEEVAEEATEEVAEEATEEVAEEATEEVTEEATEEVAEEATEEVAEEATEEVAEEATEEVAEEATEEVAEEATEEVAEEATEEVAEEATEEVAEEATEEVAEEATEEVAEEATEEVAEEATEEVAEEATEEVAEEAADTVEKTEEATKKATEENK